MKYSATIDRLRSVIERELTPLVTSDYLMLDCPYHSNIGDTLIWQGELDFLATLPFRMLGYGSYQTWDFREVPAHTTILLRGGGNFGDLWRDVQDFRLKIVRRYPNNKIVIFPQTCFYQDDGLLEKDAKLMGEHPDLTICVRDRVSMDRLSPHFRNRLLLVPDMAFYMDISKWMPAGKPHGNVDKKTLLLLRRDKEIKAADPTLIPNGAETRDWPTLERLPSQIFVLYKLSGSVIRLRKTGNTTFLQKFPARWADRLAYHLVRPYNIRTGIAFILPYETVYTTRLHGMILSLLTGVPEIHLLDNNYGKNRNFYTSWLTGTEGLFCV